MYLGFVTVNNIYIYVTGMALVGGWVVVLVNGTHG